MKKLNNHGLTAVEVIICFTITSVIVISLFKVITNYNEKQYIESKKSQIKAYENIVTKTIQDDILKNGGVYSINESLPDSNYNQGYLTLSVTFTNGNKSQLIVYFNSREETSTENYNTIYYRDSASHEESFSLKQIDVDFNEPKIDYDEDNGMLNIYVGIIDVDLGDEYSIIDMHLPLTKKWPDAYKNL